MIIVLLGISITSAYALSLAEVNDMINQLQRIADDDSEATPFEIGDFVSGLLCGCATTNTCEGIMSGICLDLTNPTVIDSEGLRWASHLLSNTESAVCSMIYQGMAYDLGLSIDNSDRNVSFQRTPNAYLEAARMFNDATLEYTYYFSFNFFPREEYSSESISFVAKQGSDTIDLNIPVLPPSDQGFRHRTVRKSSDLYERVCMKFNSGTPAGFSRNELCVRVTEI